MVGRERSGDVISPPAFSSYATPQGTVRSVCHIVRFEGRAGFGGSAFPTALLTLPTRGSHTPLGGDRFYFSYRLFRLVFVRPRGRPRLAFHCMAPLVGPAAIVLT